MKQYISLSIPLSFILVQGSSSISESHTCNGVISGFTNIATSDLFLFSCYSPLNPEIHGDHALTEGNVASFPMQSLESLKHIERF
jgi:hypothetical protein